MNVLVVNAGSSSLKFQLLQVETRNVIASGACERIAEGSSFYSYKNAAGKQQQDLDIPDHRTAVSLVLDKLKEENASDSIDAIGHRVVHGGTYFTGPSLVDDVVLEKIYEIAPLAPLHNYAAASVVETCRELMPSVPNVVCFDTSFHATMPEVAYRYALPRDLAEQLQLRKYGFHGINHEYVARVTGQLCGDKAQKIISCHLGNGSSLAAVRGGKCVETTMGFTPLEGLMMGTRCGSIDPAAVTYIIEHTDYDAHDVDMLMNKKSGLLAVSGLTNDMRDIEEQANAGDKNCQMALDMFAYSTLKHIGMLLAVLGGCDAIAFTAGAGQNSDTLRSMILDALEPLGFAYDKDLNAQRNDSPWEITAQTGDSEGACVSPRVWVVPAGEEYMIALEVQRILDPEGAASTEIKL